MSVRDENPRIPPDSCLDPAERNSLDVADARHRIRSAIQPLLEKERIALKESFNRILAEDLNAPVDVPPHANSAMDGYAVRSADLPLTQQRRLTVIGTAMAGIPFPGEVAEGQCVRIMTGGVIPRGCDTVIMQEQAVREDDVITIRTGHRAGQHVRPAGEDLAAGQRALKAGKRISAADLGLLASLGIATVPVVRRPRVAFFSTGDELRAVGEPLDEGAIYDSNRYTLHGLLLQTFVEPVDLGVVRDRQDDLRAALVRAAAQADAVISTGGVSVGDADLVRDTLAGVGEVQFWKVGMRPGRPFTFGRIAQAWFFGLPGNPVSTMATYYQFVQPALRQLMGEEAHQPLRFKVPCVSALKKSPGRMEFQRGILETSAEGNTVVRSTGGQGSNLLSSMSEANCFIVLPAAWGDVPAGTLVEVQPFAGL
jgi:molybdopterin molybdotransferase